MKKAALVVPFICQKNRIFDLADTFINRDGCMVPFAMLKEKFAASGYNLSTQDINTIDASDCVIYLEMPAVLPKPDHINKSFLLLFETELILPQNWDLTRHSSFHKIFTWNDSLVDGKKYFKMNWSYIFPEQIISEPAEKNRFCCVIAGNKASNHELELYSKRVEAIRWFEKEHPETFDLYGMGWNEVRLPGNHYFERYPPLKLIKKALSALAPKFPSYRGKIANKLQTLRQYRFSICYENARDIPGYITEKIFDCFFAGCVPVYWGAGNIAQHISDDCYIDRRKFASYEELFAFMTKMPPETYLNYLRAASRFLKSTEAYPFTARYFVETICNNTVGQNTVNEVTVSD